MIKIAIDAGHGINTAGKRTPDGEREWSFNNKVVLAAIEELKNYNNVQILRLDDPTGKTDVPLSTRTKKANDWGADVLISVHHNANSGKWGSHGGVETYTQPGSSKASKDIAAIIHPKIVKAMGLRDRGLKTKNLHMTRESKMPAVLTEGGFMDSTTDISALRDDNKLKKQGEGIAKGLAEYFKLSMKTKPTKPSKSKPSPKQKPKKSISQMADEIIAGKHGNGHANRQKSLGISNEEYALVKAEVNRRLKSSSKPKPVPAKPKPTVKTKSISQMAKEIIAGKHGNGHANRQKSLGVNDATYNKVKAEVNKLVSKPPLKSNITVAKEVILGKWGNGSERQRRLKSAGYNPSEIQKEVNRQLR